MKIKVIIQVNKETGEKNVCFTQDPITPIEDFLLPWPDSKVIVEEVLIFASDPVLDNLVDTEFRSVLGGNGETEEVNLTPGQEEALRCRLEQLLTTSEGAL